MQFRWRLLFFVVLQCIFRLSIYVCTIHKNYDLPSLVPVLYFPILKCTLKQRFKLECMYFQQKWLQAKIGFAHQWFMKCSTYIGKKHIYTTNKNLSFLFLVYTICKKWRHVCSKLWTKNWIIFYVAMIFSSEKYYFYYHFLLYIKKILASKKN